MQSVIIQIFLLCINIKLSLPILAMNNQECDETAHVRVIQTK